MRIRDFSRLEYRYAGLTGLFVMLRTTLIASTLFIIAWVVIEMLDKGVNAPGPILAGIGAVLLLERLTVGVMALKRLPAIFLFALTFIPVAVITFLLAVRMPEVARHSFYAVVLGGAMLAIYLSFSLFICAQLLHVLNIRSATVRRVLASPYESMFSATGAARIFGLPRSFVHFRRRVKRIAFTMGLSTIFFTAFPAALTVGPYVVLLYLAIPGFGGSSAHMANIDKDARDLLLGAILVAPAMIAALLGVGALLRRTARGMLAQGLMEIPEYDDRAPVLFLRAFEDDQIKLPETDHSIMARLLHIGRQSESIDTLLLEEGTQVGPVVALGNPEDAGKTPYGAARQYHSDESWMQAVDDLCERARAVVLVLENSDGVWHEVERLIAYGYASKTLFIMHPRYSSSMEYGLILDRVLNISSKTGSTQFAGLDKYRRMKRSRRFLGFHLNSKGGLRIYESREFSRISGLLLLRIFFRSSRFDPTASRRRSARRSRELEAA